MKTLYVRINPRKEAERFYRCGVEFGRDWKAVSDLDDATAQRLEEEQMLEVTDVRPAELEDEAQAGDSANAIDPTTDNAAPPAPAPDEATAAAEAAPAEAAPAEAAPAEAAPAEAAPAEAAPAATPAKTKKAK